MGLYIKELHFESPNPSAIWDLTADVDAALKKSKAKHGILGVHSKHTTLGMLVNELAETKLLDDILRFSRVLVPEDARSTWVVGQEPPYPYPTLDFTHNCADSPLRPPTELDNDHNTGRHIRALIFANPTVWIPFKNGALELGRYQQVGIFEFDGRNGQGVNPLRERVVQIWIFSVPRITYL
ncbi:YjbQ family protein [Candidatus Daviesbacteria bacterium]|nr:YjbQ family protein [Candidatus Daviesbacteria bacterium]